MQYLIERSTSEPAWDKGPLRELLPPVDTAVRAAEALADEERREKQLLKMVTGVRTGVDYEDERRSNRR